MAEVRSPEPDVPETGSWRRPDLYEAGEGAGPGLVEVTFDELEDRAFHLGTLANVCSEGKLTRGQLRGLRRQTVT